MKKLIFILLLSPLFSLAQSNWFSSYPLGAPVSYPTITNFALDAKGWCGVVASAYVIDNGSSITERGFYWTYYGDPYPSGTKIVVSGTTGNMGKFINPGNLATIQVRAFATNSVGTTISNQIEATTTDYPSTTVYASNITQTSVTLNMTKGQYSTPYRMIYYGINDVYESHTIGYVNDLDPLTWNLSSLNSNTTYKFLGHYEYDGCIYETDIETFTTTGTCVVPTLTTTSISNISDISAQSGGNITSDGGCSITARGVCWSTSQNPTVSDSHTSDGTGTGSFTSSLIGLSNNTTYYVRAYATSSSGTSYGSQTSFTTLCDLPYVVGVSIDILSTSATITSTAQTDGGCSITARGVCYATTQYPTLSNSHTTDGTGTGTFSSVLTGLTPNTTYYVRPYATNIVGTYYGNQTDITTNPSGVIVPTVTTTAPSSITETTAISGGNVTSDGGGTILTRGIEYSVNSDFSSAVLSVPSSPTTGLFTSNISGLTCGTTYYVRAYASNESGTAYGNSVTFSTELCTYIPTVSLNTINKYGDTYATFSGSVTDDGNSAVTERGFVYSTTPNPTTSSNKIISGSGVGVFSANAYGLFSSTKYYVRAYAINNVGTAYSNELDFITFESPTNVSISTSVPVNITTNSATLGGNISSDGGNTVTERGVVYGLSINPTTSNTKIQSGDGIGIYSVNVTGLTQGTTYHVRAYAINSNGTFYGADESFITSIDGATACNAGQTFPGGQSYPSTNTIVLGSGTGDVTLTFSANNIPDFFLVEYNSTLYNSGWRGSPIYDYGGTSRASFKLALFGKTDPSQNPAFPTTFPNIMLYPEDGYPRVISGSGSISFTKSTSNPTTATVKVYAPMSDTYWTYILSCPN